MAAKERTGQDLLHRWEGNPIITVEDMPFPCNTVFNGTPMVVDDGVYLLLRVEGLHGYSFFALARSEEGLHFVIDEEPVMLPLKDGPFAEYEEKGIEDPRATFLEGKWYILYTGVHRLGPVIALARTVDFMDYYRIAAVSEPGNKDGVLFPRKIKGRYARLDRPIGYGRGSIWVSYSEDLVNWGDSEIVMAPRGGYWDDYRVGASVPPIETEEGWLEIYHGTKMTSSGPIYRIGCALLDLEDPGRLIKRSVAPVLSPRADYERVGDIGNVCFACGAVVSDDGEIKVYYGAADTSICVASCDFDQLMEEGFE